MSSRRKEQVAAVYVIYLVVFGVGLVVFALWVFCLLSGPELGTCSASLL
jgi:hypothetical protein